ncbi:hypothetical protein LCGC14_0702470 [marine sediment metagenome]|uniref:AAA+ ATPase domain-containing protein n=1 Tax=marine sediment metagenome TaxID=412755 RepID=A0A0F9QM49_9ZZZZ
MSLYRKHRPMALRTFMGNDATVATLTGLLDKPSRPHFLMFTGPTGCGKTTLARIVAKELKCSAVDLQELNVADFRGIDTSRDIIARARLLPVGGDVKVWIFNECHMLTKEAQNALLVVLEDTPAHVYFLFTTTDPQKLIPAIRNRATALGVTLLKDDAITTLLERVCKRERVTNLSDTLKGLIVEYSLGSPRMALILLEKAIGAEEGTGEEGIKQIIQERAEAIKLCRALLKKEPWGRVAIILKNLDEDPERIRRAVIGYMRSTLLGSKKENSQAFLIADIFARAPFYELGRDALILACYEAVYG